MDRLTRLIAPRYRRWFWRAFWGVMAVGHAPALLGASRALLADGFDSREMGAFLGLGLATVFFALKLYDVAWLRIPNDSRCWVAVTIVFALLHVNVMSEHTGTALAAECGEIVASAVLLAGLLRAEHCKLRSTHNGNSPKHLPIPVRLQEAVWLDDIRPRCWVLVLRLFALRAPPVV